MSKREQDQITFEVPDATVFVASLQEQREAVLETISQLAAEGHDTELMQDLQQTLAQLIEAAEQTVADNARKPIRYSFYGLGEAGSRNISFEEFAETVVQDGPVAIEKAERLLRFGSDESGDDDGDWQESFELIDRAELVRQLREVHPEDLEMADFDLTLLEDPQD